MCPLDVFHSSSSLPEQCVVIWQHTIRIVKRDEDEAEYSLTLLYNVSHAKNALCAESTAHFRKGRRVHQQRSTEHVKKDAAPRNRRAIILALIHGDRYTLSRVHWTSNHQLVLLNSGTLGTLPGLPRALLALAPKAGKPTSWL